MIVNADDFGLTPGVTAGILEAHAAGTVTAASMLVRGPGWEDGVQRALATPSLDIGLHFNLLLGAPLTAARSLRAPGGEFQSLGALGWRALTGRLDEGEVIAECEAQLAALAQAGIRVTHLDSHRHTHAFPVIRRAVARVAAERGLVLRRPVESPRWSPADLKSQLHRAAVAAAWAATSPGVRATRSPDHFAGISLQGAAGPRAFAARIAALVHGLPPGTTELMVHPGRADPALAAVDGYTTPREHELAVLADAGLRDRIGGEGIALVGFGAL
ncbi:MAG: ChbG/HpnK family deacetylase [Gemmatimonadota bacterium]|nr:ChbG/HpnK family deacetylase [Gemmatimonadota bacterium]